MRLVYHRQVPGWTIAVCVWRTQTFQSSYDHIPICTWDERDISDQRGSAQSLPKGCPDIIWHTRPIVGFRQVGDGICLILCWVYVGRLGLLARERLLLLGLSTYGSNLDSASPSNCFPESVAEAWAGSC